MRIGTLRLGFALLALSAAPAAAFSPHPTAADNGIVVTAHHLASQVGADVLRAGGNAVDAAVAVGYALAVVYPSAGNLGGGGFMTLRLADGRTSFIDFRETAPLAATPTMYLDAKGEVVKGLSTDSWLAVGVPGTVAGLEYARMTYGTAAREALIAPAIRLAADGFVLGRHDVDIFARSEAALAKDPAAAAVYLKDGKARPAGERLVQGDLAAALRLISERGADGFYRGPIAEAIVAASQAGKGILSKADFEAYKVRELKPIDCDYRGWQIISAPPPSSGGVIICEILNIIEGYDMAALGYRSAESVHYMIEAMRHAYVDRNTYLGDPDFVKNPVERLLDDAYAAQIRAVIDPKRAGDSRALKPGVPPHEGTQTTHYSIVDRAGNAVAVTYTLNASFGAKLMAPGTGILLNNEMDDFTAKPGVANLYGLVQGEANAIAPGKRPLSSMSPTIVLREGKPVIVIGSPGGSRIITITLGAIVNMVDYGMTVQEAIDAPRIHHQWMPETTYVERFALSPDTQRILTGMGHQFTEQAPWGSASGILVGSPAIGAKSPGGARLFGAADSRTPTGAAVGH